MLPAEPPAPDPWARLRAATRARIGLGRVGDALPLAEVLGFQLAHARARDAVHAALDVGAVMRDLAPLRCVAVQSAAADRATYLRRPDLGRVMDDGSQSVLATEAGGWDVVFVAGDGLSPVAVQQQAGAMVRACVARLPGWTAGPVVVARQARVALGDDIGARLGARFVVMLIGERPGLSVANSLGVYVTYAPRVGRRDSERNCISNIHPHGTSVEAAADLLTWLLMEADRRKLTGVELKDDRDSSQVSFTHPAVV